MRLNNLAQTTRLNDWLYSFIPQIFGNIYLWLLLFKIRLNGSSILLLISSLLTSLGFAALGYFINEYFDKKDDAKAGKLNRLSVINTRQKIVLFLSICAIAFLPWLFLPYNYISLGLMAGQCSLFILYAAPPFRLKKQWLAAIIIDALYAYVIPFLLSIYTYRLFAHQTKIDLLLIITYLIGLFLTGVRNIIIHYINDIFRDKQINNYTFPRVVGIAKTNLLLKLCMYSEFVLITVVDIRLLTVSALFWAMFVALGYLIIRFVQMQATVKNNIIVFHSVRHTPDVLFQFYQPVLFLAILLFFDWHWCILVPFHLFFLVSKSQKQAFLSAIHIIQRVFYQAISFVVNYSIYYFFRLFSVDLIKEEKSALDYLKSKWK